MSEKPPDSATARLFPSFATWTRSRRKPVRSITGLLRFDDLPDDILILILSHCRIDEIFALRLTSSRFSVVIDAYSNTIIPSVAWATFTSSSLILAGLPKPADYTFAWLKRLIPLQLAAVLVDRHRFIHQNPGAHRYGIPAEDDYGDALRARVTTGFCVQSRLANIAEDVYRLDDKAVLESVSKKNMPSKLLRPSRYRFELFQIREEMILERRVQLIESLPASNVQDYVLMSTLLSGAFRVGKDQRLNDHPPWVFDWDYGIDGPRAVRTGKSWLSWFILRRGPQLFWEQWWSLPRGVPETQHHIRTQALEAYFADAEMNAGEDICGSPPKIWRDVNEATHEVHRAGIGSLQKVIADKTGHWGNYSLVDPYPYFVRYAEIRRERQEEGRIGVEETLDQVPFFVDFCAV